jgi:hypothetical protein
MHAPYAAAAFAPQGAAEADLCRAASHFDWIYLGALVLADAGTVTLDALALQSSPHAGVRLLGPGFVGFTWGWTVPAIYLTLPQCSPDFVPAPPLEGDLRTLWPLALSFSLLAAATAPVLVGVETGEGTSTLAWSGGERATRLLIAGGAGVIGSMMPYLLPPRTWRALRKLRDLRTNAEAHGALVSYTVTF